MKNQNGHAKGKILHHDKGRGITDATDVEQRAGEIARIEGHELSETDRQQAERELDGDDIPPATDEDADSRGAMSRDPSEPVSNFGHQVPDRESEDEQFAAERLVAEGVNEAEHDQMLAARRKKNS